MIVPYLGLAVAADFAVAAVFLPATFLEPLRRTGVLVTLCVPLLLSPLLIPADEPFVRFLASVTSVLLVVKLYNLHLDAGRGSRPDWRTFAIFLPNLFSFVLRKLGAEPRPSRRDNLIRLGCATVGLAAGAAILGALFLVDWNRYPFVVEHCTKVTAFFLMLMPLAAAAATGWRLMGGSAREPMHNPFVARTPADFWRRYNRPMQQFFYEDIFKRAGGLRSPIRATLVTFAVSAILHEYIFGIAIGRVQGYQTTFFLLQGAAVAATMRINPEGWWALPWIAGTFAFNLASSVFFFASFNGLLPFYSNGLPAWLGGE